MKNQRRDFLKTMLVAVGASVLMPKLSFAQERRRGSGAGDLPLVEPGKGMAATLHYQHKTSDVKDAKLKTERQGTPFAKQNCSNCLLYTKHGMQGAEEVGKCSLFAGQVVKASGWCNSWAKRP
ncbi:MAG: hypothetical protein A2622_12780 [Bdellovibrionales bacterium RIFCSPHIGHO2_01_FULL_40_29]|nr:MAG: hypothetical protein A2622_12780 [Bdellovibrionales bacterium RIFCSPHIGHO2_01_FULL_40_29]OFZ33430.1 MAG: hypothetical protein A3D17_14105 [Bdellovibrionales bacterium RIFCSPHIGHO2_02_FULL_40_15]